MNNHNYLESFIEKENMNFIGINALGILQKDLVAVLGVDRAKGFLLRYSRQCGEKDARYLKENFLFEPEIELLHAGYKINVIRGHAKITPIELKVNKQTDEFYLEHHFSHSFEAKQYLERFGKHTEPVCHTLTGYASGYASEYFGEEILFKEVSCIGKGDPHCILIGKLKRDWGSDLNEMIPYYQEENLSIELDKAYKQIEKQKKDLSDALDISENLSKILLKGGDISKVLEELSKSLSCTVLFEDRNFNIMGHFGNYSPYDFKGLIEKDQGKELPWIKTLIEEKSTVELCLNKDFGYDNRRLISPIILNKEIWGYISLIKEDGIFDEMEHILLERANTICALHFSNERATIEAERRITGGLLNELLMDNPDLKSLDYRMKLMGYDLNKEHYIYLLMLNDQKVNKEIDIDFKNKIIDEINYQMQPLGKKCLLSGLLNQIIILVPKEIITGMSTTYKKFGDLLIKNVHKKYSNICFLLGISSNFNGIDKFRKAYDEANKAISILNRKKGFANRIAFDDLGYLGFLLNSTNMEELEGFANNLLSRLLVYDKEYNSELLKTLYYILEFQGNIANTSKKLMISDGAARYRFKRIAEITNLDLNTTEDFLNAHLALQIFLHLGVWDMDL
jgi:PucR family transcriptional regulator, purine catabolism regulatory protein